MDDLATLQAQLDKLRAERAKGIRRLTYSDGRSVEYASLDEMGRVADDLAARIAIAQSRQGRVILTTYSKGV